MNASAKLTFGLFDRPLGLSDAATDEVLVKRGDAASFAERYERHLPGVYRYMATRAPSPEEAEDLTSEVFQQAWGSLGSYRSSGSFRAWMFGIARRTVADHYRRRRPAAHLDPATAARLPDQEPTPEDQAVQSERARGVRLLLEGLSPEQQEVLSLRFAAELTYAEIATIIRKREEAVKKIAYRALEAVRGRNMNASAI
jgi:RNA polymerase sigma-70 factor (ECF subfamily)